MMARRDGDAPGERGAVKVRRTVLTVCRTAVLGALVIGVLAGCGRRGPPITPEAAAAEETHRQSGSIVPLAEHRDPEKLPKPNRPFLLDPLL
jgi:predicted small lipoprotein YifL